MVNSGRRKRDIGLRTPGVALIDRSRVVDSLRAAVDRARVPQYIELAGRIRCHSNPGTEKRPSAAEGGAIGRRTGDVQQSRGPGVAAIGRLGHVKIHRAFGSAVLCVTVPGKVNVAGGIDRTTAGERPTKLCVGIHLHRSPCHPAVVRRRTPHYLRVIVGDVHIVAAHCQNIFVGPGIRRVGDHGGPGLAKIG